MANVILISYDNGSHIPFFPINLFYLTGALISAKHEVKVLWQDIDHFPDREITEWIDNFTFKDNRKADVVGLGFVGGYYQYGKASRISESVNLSKRRKEFSYVLGGHGPASEPSFFIRRMSADYIVVGDGENAIRDISEKKPINPIVEAVAVDIDESPLWLYPHFQTHIYRLIRWPTSERTDFCMPILSSRGCKWHCSFCYRMREGFWERDVKAIMDEIRYLHRTFGINHFQFADELLMGSKERTEEICNAILRLNFKIKWDCNGRLNFAIPHLLTLMKKSGCEYINYGIESLNQTILNQMGKGLTVERINQGVTDTLLSKISPGLNFIWGFPGDTVENLRECADFIIKYDPGHELRTIRPVTPYPGTPLFKLAVERGLVKNVEDFYENKHKNSDLITVNFMDISTEEAHKELLLTNARLMRSYQEKRYNRTFDSAEGMYIHGKSFRGYREV